MRAPISSELADRILLYPRSHVWGSGYPPPGHAHPSREYLPPDMPNPLGHTPRTCPHPRMDLVPEIPLERTWDQRSHIVCRQNDWQTPGKTLPSPNFVGGQQLRLMQIKRQTYKKEMYCNFDNREIVSTIPHWPSSSSLFDYHLEKDIEFSIFFRKVLEICYSEYQIANDKREL